MKVPFNYLRPQFAESAITEAIFSEWRELVASGEFTLGSYVERFEQEFAAYTGARYCISTNSGTDALILALRSQGIGLGDEVITVTNTFYATVGAVVAVGAKPVLVDCDNRYQIEVAQIASAITPCTKALLPVHWAGASPDMLALQTLAEKHGLILLEDACMGIGGKVQGRHPGRWGKVGAFSMHPLKSLNVMGDGGMVITDDEATATWMRKYRNHGMVERDHIEFWGANMRLQPLQAVVARHVLATVPDLVAQRQKNAQVLDDGLPGVAPYVSIPPRPTGDQETYALYMVLCERRNELLAYLKEHGVEAKVHYPVPLHLQPAAASLGYAKGSFPVAEAQADQLLTLPVHQYLNEEHMAWMIKKIAAFY
jgi:dTDP-3-amino-2,3,6-trideoxy-4-keto-D-glucose/dTDP-3-amino-3,4,6-trideoxy-alpha-D-glucose/dTDP-2,6-dideoxy-D-kanosamine transaminase